MFCGATRRTTLSGLGTIIIIRWYIIRPYPEQRHHNAGAHRSLYRFTIASTCLKKKQKTQARLDLCLCDWSWNVGERYCTITVMTYRGLTAGTLSFMLLYKSGSLGGRMSRGVRTGWEDIPELLQVSQWETPCDWEPTQATFNFWIFFLFWQ